MGENLYHHGDLKKEMIQKGIQLLNKDGYEGFSLRKLAAMCNVSHSAPYRHFESKNDLYKAINLEITTKFRDALMDRIEQFQDDPKARLLELCKRYISFMVKNPDYFRYIFMTTHERQILLSLEDALFEEDKHPFTISKRYAKEYFCLRNGSDTDWVSDFLALWSQIHGLTLLLVNQTIKYKGDYMEFAHRMIEKQLNS
ncbi:MAG: TetR/AcrR family transcriptional regulator [Bacillota bacterium]